MLVFERNRKLRAPFKRKAGSTGQPCGAHDRKNKGEGIREAPVRPVSILTIKWRAGAGAPARRPGRLRPDFLNHTGGRVKQARYAEKFQSAPVIKRGARHRATATDSLPFDRSCTDVRKRFNFTIGKKGNDTKAVLVVLPTVPSSERDLLKPETKCKARKKTRGEQVFLGFRVANRCR